jgi:hypothetical protein
MTPEQIQHDFDVWWYIEGSGITPQKGHDWEEHSKRVAEIAWKHGASKRLEHVWKNSFKHYTPNNSLENTNQQ